MDNFTTSYRIGLYNRTNGNIAVLRSKNGTKKYRYCVHCGGLVSGFECNKCKTVTACSWCNKVLDVDGVFKNIPHDKRNANHTICHDCFEGEIASC